MECLDWVEIEYLEGVSDLLMGAAMVLSYLSQSLIYRKNHLLDQL